MRARSWFAHIFLAVAFIALAGVPAAARAPADTLRLGLIGLPPSLGNPYRTTNIPSILTWGAIFDGLTRIDGEGRLQPWLALSWEVIDPTTWRFRLRPNVTFSNGEKLTAAAVVNAVEYLVGPGRAIEGTARELQSLAGARIVDALTVDILTKYPDPILPRSLPIMYIVAPDQWQRLGADGFAREPVGTGPYRLDRWEPSRASLSAFEESWRAPKIPKLEIYAIPEGSARTQGVGANQIDIALAIGPDDARAAEAAGGKGVHWIHPGVMGVAFVLVNNQNANSPVLDRRVRQALNYAVNKQAIVDALLYGTSVPRGQPAPAVAWGHNPAVAPYPYDPGRAKALLAQAGYPNGFSMVLEATIGGGAADAAMYQQVAADLAAIGVAVEIRTIPVQTLLRNSNEGGWSGDAFGMSFATEPSVTALRPLRVWSCLWLSPWYCNRALQPQIDAALREFDEEKRLRMVQDIMAAYHEDAPAIFLYDVVRFGALTRRVQNFKEENGFINFHEMTFAN
jgi:peptide/nickel transport system substrate-binding protein